MLRFHAIVCSTKSFDEYATHEKCTGPYGWILDLNRFLFYISHLFRDFIDLISLKLHSEPVC